MKTLDLDDDDEVQAKGSLLKDNWVMILIGAVLLSAGIAAAIKLASTDGAGSRKAQDNLVMITLPPPVVIPPPPPKPEMEDPMTPAEDDKPLEPPPADPGPSTGVVGNGPPDIYNLPPPGRGGLRRTMGTPTAASKWTPYARTAAARIAEAVSHHRQLRHATLNLTVRVWIDGAGRVSRSEIQSSGNAGTDAALRDDVLTGLQLSEPPPDGMKMPVNLRLTARRPG